MIKGLFKNDPITQASNQELVRKLILFVPLTAFLQHFVISAVAIAVALICCILPGVRNQIFKAKGSILMAVFFGITVIVSLCYKNYVGFGCAVVFAALFIDAFVARSLATHSFFERLTDMAILSACLSTVCGIVDYFIHFNIEGFRCKGFYTNPNFFGLSLSVAIIICAYKVCLRTDQSLLYYAAATFCAIGLYLCGSMSLWMLCFIAVILMLLLNRQFKLLSLFLLCVCIITAILLLVPGPFSRVSEISATFGYRKDVWQGVFRHLGDAPLFGRGFYTYKYLFKEYIAKELYKEYFMYDASLSHNIYLDALLCHGIIGSAIAGTSFFQYIRSLIDTRKLSKRTGYDARISSLIISLLIALAIYCLIDTTIVLSQTLAAILFVCSGLGVEDNQLKNHSQKD